MVLVGAFPGKLYCGTRLQRESCTREKLGIHMGDLCSGRSYAALVVTCDGLLALTFCVIELSPTNLTPQRPL